MQSRKLLIPEFDAGNGLQVRVSDVGPEGGEGGRHGYRSCTRSGGGDGDYSSPGAEGVASRVGRGASCGRGGVEVTFAGLT